MEKKAKAKIFLFSREHIGKNNIIESINYFLDVESPGNYRVDSKRLKELVNNPLFDLYLLEIMGEIVGMASLHYVETLAKKAAWLEDVVVHPKHQGKGLGKNIIRHVTSEAKKKGVKHVDLTSRNIRKKAHKFYEKLNFEKRKTSVYRMKMKK